MHEAPLVQMFQGPRDLFDEVDRPLERQGPAASHQVVNIGPFDKLQGDEEMPVNAAGIVDGDDVFVLELRGGLRLRLEAANEDLVFRGVFGQDLEGDGPLQLRVDREVNRPHAAAPSSRTISVLAQLGATVERLSGRHIGRTLAPWGIRSRSHRHLGR